MVPGSSSYGSFRASPKETGLSRTGGRLRCWESAPSSGPTILLKARSTGIACQFDGTTPRRRLSTSRAGDALWCGWKREKFEAFESGGGVPDEPAEPQEGEVKSNFWIFQANPKLFDIDLALQDLDEISWLVRQHQRELKVGDRVFLWRSGKDSGIAAGKWRLFPAPGGSSSTTGIGAQVQSFEREVRR